MADAGFQTKVIWTVKAHSSSTEPAPDFHSCNYDILVRRSEGGPRSEHFFYFITSFPPTGNMIPLSQRTINRLRMTALAKLTYLNE